MVYKQGVNKVANDEVFPYPLKCWYDDENIYVQVLRIPEPEECKLSPYVMNGVNKGLYNINNYDRESPSSMSDFTGHRGNYFYRLYLCLEIYTGSTKRYNRSGHKKYDQRSSAPKYPKLTNFIRKSSYPFFHLQSYKNSIIEIPIQDKYFNRVALGNKQRKLPYYTKIRASVRFLVVRKGNVNSSILETTGVYSNVINIRRK